MSIRNTCKVVLITILTLVSTNALALTESFVPTLWDAAFYTFAFTGLVYAACTILAYNEQKWLVYIGLALLLVINAASMDGSLAYVVGRTDFITWVVPFLITTITAAYGYWVIAIRLELPHKLAKFKPLFMLLAGLSGLLVLSTPIWLEKIALNIMWVPANILFFGMSIGQVLPPLTWPSYSEKQRLFIRAFPVIASTFAIGGFLAFSASSGSNQQDINNLYRWSLLLFAFFALTIVIWQVFSQRKEKETAQLSAVDAAMREAETKLALIEADKAYQQAFKAATNQQKQLATVSHDLKQPISALRLAADQLRQTTSEDADKLSKAIDYIDSLSRSYLDSKHQEIEEKEDGRENVSTDLLGKALLQMFETETDRKGIRFRVIAMHQTICVEPLSTMRTMTNIISNAIAHSGASKILVGFRKQGEIVRFQVHDNGCGIDDSIKNNIFVMGEKGEQSQGEGLGLGIVQELCRSQGMPLKVESLTGKGTSFYIDMPLSKRNGNEK